MATFLVDHHLLEPEDIVGGELEIIDASRRHLNFRVTTNRGKNYLVKQGIGVERSSTLAREARFLQGAGVDVGARDSPSHLPAVRAWDPARCILVLDLLADARSLTPSHLHGLRQSERVARRFGSVLRSLHRWQPNFLDADPGTVTNDGPPWVLSIHRPQQAVIDRLSVTGLEILKIVQATRSLCTGLDELRGDWQATSIIHGDVTWDNIMVSAKADHDYGRAITLVDWELVQLGDPLWDAGSFLSQYLGAWIASIPAGENTAQAQARAARIPLERLQTPMRLFWQSYAQGMAIEPSASTREIVRMVRYAAARLILTAVETEQMNLQLSNAGVLRLQVAQNMLQRPGAAATSLLGMRG